MFFKKKLIGLEKYNNKILDKEDNILFQEAAKSFANKAFRAAYVMLWLACIESLKRRFNLAQKWDNEAGIIVGKINDSEASQRAIDKLVLEKAKEYGFIDNYNYTRLLNIYTMRCIYAHPYEKSPNVEEVFNASAIIVDSVLSHPLKLRHGFVTKIIKDLSEDKFYLDDNIEKVCSFVDEILPRIDETIFSWMLKQLLSKIDDLSKDASLTNLYNRNIWFVQRFLVKIPIDAIDDKEWFDLIKKYPNSFIEIINLNDIYSRIGNRSQDYLINYILDSSKSNPRKLNNFCRLIESGKLEPDKIDKFTNHLDENFNAPVQNFSC